MTQDEIIRMAREAGIEQHRTMPDMTINLIHFAALVAEATKEKAAKVCEDYDAFGFGTRDKFATAIRSMK